jgi:hypothetical protein
MNPADLKTLDLETEDVTSRSWEELVNDLVDSDENPDLFVNSGDCGYTTSTTGFCYTSTTCDSD